MNRYLKTLMAGAAVATLTAGSLGAQQAHGLWIGASSRAVSLQSVSSDGIAGSAEKGTSAVTGMIGWRGDSTVSAFIGVTRVMLPQAVGFRDDIAYQEIAVGARFQLPQYGMARIHPFLDLAVVPREYRATFSADGGSAYSGEKMRMTGLGGNATVGVTARLMAGFDLVVDAGLTMGQFRNMKVGGEARDMSAANVLATRFGVGLVFNPSAWR